MVYTLKEKEKKETNRKTENTLEKTQNVFCLFCAKDWIKKKKMKKMKNEKLCVLAKQKRHEKN